MNERKFRRGLITLVIAVVILTSVMYILPEPVRGASPTINYVSPADEATFVDVWRGEGVNLTVNVTDADGDLNQVVLKWNNSGTWATFYDSGALGGVSYHNITVLNSNFTGSWETYEWQVCAYDTAWTNTTYSFTTEYVFGDPQPIVVDDTKDVKISVMYKNTTSDYYLWADIGNIGVITSTNGVDFAIQTIADTGIGGDYPYNAFTYNNIPYLYYYASSYLRYLWYNQTAGAWQSESTSIRQYEHPGSYYYYVYGADVKYYNGEWCLVANARNSGSYLTFFTSDNPLNSFNYQSSLQPTGGQFSSDNHRYSWVISSLNILNGKLILNYLDSGRDLHWQVYDGTSWTDKGVIEENLGTSSNEIQGHWQSTLKDPVNNQLVCIYINASGWLVYRTLTDPDGTWSNPIVIYKPKSGESIGYPHADYIDRRIVITFSSNLRGNYNIYMITAPDYTAVTSGVNITYNRIQFPDATPNQEHANSTVFAIKNINDRPILNITWHVGDIGEIQTANNIRVWSNMSGSWQSWDVGADQNTSKIDISAVKGSEWQPGETLYWKIEILNTGNVAETLHTNDNDIWYIVDLGT